MGPVPGSDIVPVDLTPHHFRTTRVALAVESVILLVLGLWGVIAALTAGPVGALGPAVLIFHLSLGHGIVLAVTGLLAAVAMGRHRWAFWFTTTQAVVYLMLFMFSTGRLTWISGTSADDLLHAALGIIGLAMLIWLSPRGLMGWRWERRRGAGDRPGGGDRATR